MLNAIYLPDTLKWEFVSDPTEGYFKAKTPIWNYQIRVLDPWGIELRVKVGYLTVMPPFRERDFSAAQEHAEDLYKQHRAQFLKENSDFALDVDSVCIVRPNENHANKFIRDGIRATLFFFNEEPITWIVISGMFRFSITDKEFILAGIPATEKEINTMKEKYFFHSLEAAQEAINEWMKRIN